MFEGINVLDDKYVKFRKGLDSIAEKDGLESRITIRQIIKMLDSLDEEEKRLDDLILGAFDSVCEPEKKNYCEQCRKELK